MTRWALGVALALALSACGGPSTASGQAGTVTVFAAASLLDAFRQIADAVEQADPGLSVTLNVGASSALAQQIVSGAPADLFAAASPATMATVIDAGEAAAPQVFARNRLQIAVPADNPGQVTGLADFADPDRTFALCAAEVPCGAAAAAVFSAAGIRASPDTLEQDVRAALSKVVLGEVDAALVYRTDVLAAGSQVRGIGFPEAEQAPSDYLLATLTSAPNAPAAEVFAAYVLSSEGQRILAKAGFELP